MKSKILKIPLNMPKEQRPNNDESSVKPPKILYQCKLPKRHFTRHHNAKKEHIIITIIHVDSTVDVYVKKVLIPIQHIIKCIQFHPDNDTLVNRCLTKYLREGTKPYVQLLKKNIKIILLQK